MNWTASLLRNQLKKQKEAYENRLNLLTNTSLEASNFFALEEKLAQTKASLAESEKNLTYCLNQTKSKDQAHQEQLLAKESEITKLTKKIATSKEQIFNLKKEIRENSLYYQRSLRTSTQNLKEQLANTKKELVHSQKELAEWQGESKDDIRELKARAKLITQLEQQTKEQKKQLDLANSKSKQLQPLFQEIITKLNKSIFVKKKDLKETLQQIQELMQWQGIVSVASTSATTPNPEEE